MIDHILVTGGAGYIGSVLVRKLISESLHVRVLDRLTFGKESLQSIINEPHFDLIEGDIRDEKVVEKALAGIDAVCHLAAIVGDPACKAEPDVTRSINWDASVNLHSACKAANIQRFIFASTCSNYGKMDENDGIVNEESPLNPISLYAKLKVQFENYLLDSNNNQGIQNTILRFSTVYGKSPRQRFDLTVNEFTRDVTLGEELTIYGQQFWRPYCHVNDLANAVFLSLQADGAKVENQAFNVGDNSENYTKKQLIEQIENTVGPFTVNYVTKDEDPRDYKVNFDKINDVLKFEIDKRIPDGILEIHNLVKSGEIADPYASKYSNS